MKTRTINVYTFAELSPAAKERAKSRYLSLHGFSWSDDYLASLRALAAHFGGKLKTYSIDWFNSSYSDAGFEMPDEMEETEIAARLAKLGTFDEATLKGKGDCVLTGFCADEAAIDGFRIEWSEGTRDLGKLMQAAFRSWLKEGQDDCEGEYKDDAFAEHCDLNGYEFTESGDAPPR